MCAAAAASAARADGRRRSYRVVSLFRTSDWFQPGAGRGRLGAKLGYVTAIGKSLLTRFISLRVPTSQVLPVSSSCLLWFTLL